MPSEKVTFKGAFGDDLSAKLDWPETGLKSWVLFAHGFSIGKDLKPVRTISKSLVDNGFGMMRFDFTGLGESGGNFADTNFSSNCEDIRKAAEYLRDDQPNKKTERADEESQQFLHSRHDAIGIKQWDPQHHRIQP